MDYDSRGAAVIFVYLAHLSLVTIRGLWFKSIIKLFLPNKFKIADIPIVAT